MKIIEKRIKKLIKKLRQWEYAYYLKNESETSDEEYDKTLQELRQLEFEYPCLITENSPTKFLGKILENNFRQVYHRAPMLSLNSVMNKSQLLLFNDRIEYKLRDNNQNKSIIYCCELKIDGVAISLLYKSGKLLKAATRGDGKIGEDVTKNVRVVSSIPECLRKNDGMQLPYLLEIRGEIFISKLCFLKLNQKILKSGNKPFSNARNAASGSLRQLNPNITASRSLMFYCYGISYYVGADELPNSHWDRLQLCLKLGIPINDHIQLVNGVDKVLKYYDHITYIRSNLKYDIDGIVVKVDNCVFQKKLGYGTRAPHWAIAYKFPAESKLTQLNDIIFKVGRTGLITPIVYIKPIVINNVVIKKVSMHNVNEIRRFNLMFGDTVLVQRSGDVIPKIVKVILSKRTNDMKVITLPQFCPVCGTLLITSNCRSSVLRCPAKLICLAQRKSMLKHFVSRKAMNIHGMGEKVINQLVDKNLVFSPVDFFYLNRENLLFNLDGYGVKSVEKLLRSIDLAKHTTLANFIYALGIPNVGESVANSLAVKYKTIEKLISADFQSLSTLQYVGDSIAFTIYSFFKDPINLKNIKDLINPDIGIRWILNN
ncbi:DNA ligase [Candidatus Blochmanniella vafra str. BVAF]|uniref:DNA ligase n=1 Tax=Blochmanniella vafra (strain BVAF) TaxID=859654 RepID=E8Q766_BLOVB|nr:NAD-dependent DNA ligase LigA [Candidatus Blochmannia vafer]ADV33890.1 DNA ligase [Candidatus Blochmannia vafer str. BVAF]